MAYKVIILYRLYMPSYFLGTFTEYPYITHKKNPLNPLSTKIRFSGFFILNFILYFKVPASAC